MTRSPIALAGLAFLLVAATGARAQVPAAAPPASAAAISVHSSSASEKSAPPADAILSPDGDRSVWPSANGHNLFSATRAAPSSGWALPIRLCTVRGTISHISFSPTSASLAFAEARTTADSAPAETWSFIAVFHEATRRIDYIDPSFASDTDPHWSADGRTLSFTRKVGHHPDQNITVPIDQQQPKPWQPPPRKPSEAFTLASILAAPIVYPPQASADGHAVAYIARQAEDRAIYFMSDRAPAHRIADFPSDDGQDLTSLALSRTGAAVAFVRGGPPNDQGDSPNPTALPDPPHEQLWIVGSGGNDVPHFLGIGSDPQFTPDDRSIIWTVHDAVLSATLVWRNGHLAGVGPPQEFLNTPISTLHFSPDGSNIAFEHEGVIQIYSLSTRSTVVIPHTSDPDSAPTWSPDGQHLAFLRNAASPGKCGNWRYCGPERSANTWSIWQISLADLQPRAVWHADPNVTGSIYYPLDQSLTPGQHSAQLFWSADDRIAFVWERDGWRHLYAVPSSGGVAHLLTPGDGEIETAAVSLDHRQLIYATNIGDLGHRHLALVNFDGSHARAITSGDASAWSPTPLAAGAFAFIRAGWAHPPAIVLLDRHRTPHTASLPRTSLTFPAAHLVKPQLVQFPGTDGQIAFGQLFLPAHTNGCAIIFAHGGIRRQMLPGFHYMDIYANLYEMNQYLASRGCIVLSVEYRSSIMRGEAFRNAPGWGFAGNSEMLDVLGGARYLLARKDVDPHRLGIYGLSWGGYITAEALSRHSEVFAAGTDFAGVHASTNAAGYKFSALANVATWSSPVFLAQGDDDRNVSFADGLQLARALQEQRPQVEFEQLVLPGETHEISLTFKQQVQTYGAGLQFLLHHLGVP